jgi:hypothetical protein
MRCNEAFSVNGEREEKGERKRKGEEDVEGTVGERYSFLLDLS